MPTSDYRVEVAFVDEDGGEVVETGKLLLTGEGQPTSGWEAGQEEIEYYTLSSLAEMALGKYGMEVLVCDPRTGDGLSTPS